MNTRRTGAGRYVPSMSAERIRGQCFRLNAGNSSTVIPSIPGAPAFALTRRQASSRFSLAKICSIMVLLLNVPMLPSVEALTASSPSSVIGCDILHAVGTFLFGSALRSIRFHGLPRYYGLC